MTAFIGAEMWTRDGTGSELLTRPDAAKIADPVTLSPETRLDHE